MENVWIFHGEGARFSSSVFESLEKAEDWIGKNTLSGILSQYPVNKGVYNWAVENQFFEVKSANKLLLNLYKVLPAVHKSIIILRMDNASHS